MSRTALLIAFAVLAPLVTGCGGSRLSHDEIRKQIAEIGGSSLVPRSVDVRRVVSQSANSAIAETSVNLAVQFERTGANAPWEIAAVRLGDQNWIGIPELVAALNESRRRDTAASLEKLSAGIASYRQRNGGASPSAKDIVTLTDTLHPQYMPDLIRLDAWGKPIEYEASGAIYQLRSFGSDGLRGTSDDILVPEAAR